MKKPLAVVIVLMSLVFIVLSTTNPLRNYTYSFLTSVTNGNSAKPVVFYSHSSSKYLINDFTDFTYAAHRGAPMISNEPENSLPTFKASKQLGFKIVETDLQLTKDGQWVIMHDYTLDRTSNGKGTVKSHSLRDIKQLKLKGNKNESLSIPTLDDFLKLCRSEGLMPILDIKPNESQISSENYNSLLTSLNKYNLLDKSIFCSTSREVLTELRRRDDLTTIAVMLNVSQDNLNLVKKLNNAFIYCNYKDLTDENIDLIKKDNLKFGVWTVNDENIAEHFFEKGASLVVTDKLQRKLQKKI